MTKSKCKLTTLVIRKRNWSVSNLSEALVSMQQSRGLNGLELADLLGINPVIASRLLNDRQPVGHGTMARLLVKLNSEEATRLLQAYFEDETRRILTGRLEKARELGVRMPREKWTFEVTVKAKG